MGRNPEAAQRFAKWLDITMENRGLANRMLADKVGVSESMVGRWRSGKSIPSIESCQKLAIALDVRDWLRVAVTAGHIDSETTGIQPLPPPAPTAVRARLRQQLEQLKGLPKSGIEAALAAFDEEMQSGRVDGDGGDET